MIDCTRKKKISWEIDVSLQQGVKHERGDVEAFTLDKKEQRGKNRKVKRRKEGYRRIITRGDGLVWVLPYEVLEEYTWRKEQQRREIMRRWEAPPLGPPGTRQSFGCLRWRAPLQLTELSVS